MNTASTASTTPIGTSCTNYNGGQVSITVPSSGKVLVQAQAWLQIDHVSGTDDLGYVTIGNSPTDCASAVSYWYVQVPASEATNAALNIPTFEQRAFAVTAGTYTFYINGIMTSGQDAGDHFWFGNMAVVFYPS